MNRPGFGVQRSSDALKGSRGANSALPTQGVPSSRQTVASLEGTAVLNRQNAQATPRKLFAGLASVLVLFVLAAQGLRLAGDPSGAAWVALRGMKRPLDLAIVGDSRAHVGLSPGKLAISGADASAGPLSVYNFAADGTDALHHSSFVINGLLRQAVPPSVVVWVPNPLSFNENRKNNRLEQFTLRDSVLLFKSGAPFETVLEIATSAVFPPYRQRVVVKRLLTEFTDRLAWLPVHVQTRILKLAYEPLKASREYLQPEAGYAPFKIVRWSEAFERGVHDYTRQYGAARLCEVRLVAARSMLREARRAGVHVVIVEMPLAPWFLKHLEPMPFHQLWRAGLQKLALEEGADFISDAAAGSRDEDFGDPAHMCREAAEAYSQNLGERLRSLPAVHAALEKARSGAGEL